MNDLALITDVVFVRETLMSQQTFDNLPTLPAPDWVRSVRPGQLCRTLFETDGHAGGWHAIAIINMNGTDRAVASRIIVRSYQRED